MRSKSLNFLSLSDTSRAILPIDKRNVLCHPYLFFLESQCKLWGKSNQSR